MQEYILYVIMVFLPIGAIMAYLLQREGVSRRNIAMVVIISWLIIVTFPLSIAKLGTFIALLTYIVAILVMTRYLLGNKKEYVIESKGTLVTGSELEQLMVNLERQGYDISTDSSEYLVSLDDEQAINSLIAQQAAEPGAAEIPEPANLLAEMGINETPIEETQEMAEDAITKPDIFSQLDAKTGEILTVDIEDKDNTEEEKAREDLPAEAAAGDASDLPDTAGRWLSEHPEEGTELIGTIPDETPDLQEAMDIPEKVGVDELESKIQEDSDSQETVKVVPELELLAGPETTLPNVSEEPHPEEAFEALPEQTVAETINEPEKEAEQTVDSISEAIADEPADENPEPEDTAEAEPVEQTVGEDLGIASLDVFDKESEIWAESDEAAKTREISAEILQELGQGEAVDNELTEDSSSETEEPAGSLEMEDIQTADDTVEAETQEAEELAEIISDAVQIPAVQDLDETPAEIAPFAESVLTEAEELAAASLDLVHDEINEIAEDDTDLSSGEAKSETEEPAGSLEMEDIQTADDTVEAETQEAEELAEIISDAVQIPAVQDLDETPAEIAPVAESVLTEAEEHAAASMYIVEAENIDALESDNNPSLEEISSEPIIELEASEPLETAVADFTEPKELPEAEPETFEIIGESGRDTEKPEPGLEPDEPIEIEYSAEPEESPELVENLPIQAEQTILEIAEETADETETMVESGPLADQAVAPAPLLYELIDQGFALKEMGNWQEAVQCFMDADALTEDAELKELLNVEIVAIFRLLS
ncbi:MAG: hypothetical protein ABFD18_08395 [Syntrophomonas sp.]